MYSNQMRVEEDEEMKAGPTLCTVLNPAHDLLLRSSHVDEQLYHDHKSSKGIYLFVIHGYENKYDLKMDYIYIN